MKPAQFLLPLCLLFCFNFITTKALIPLAGEWEFQHLDVNNSNICCPFSSMTVELDKDESIFGHADRFVGKAKFYKDSDERCLRLFEEESLKGIDLRRNYGYGIPENQTKATFKYSPNKTKEYYKHEIFFTVMNNSKILKVEYDVNMTTKERMCEYTMQRPKGLSLLQIALMSVMLVIVIIGAVFGLRRLKQNASIKFERERLLRSVDYDDSFIKTN